MTNVVVVGSQWGDEGKGKIVDWLSERADLVVRFQGGHNAGHTLVVDGTVYKLSLLPSGVVREGKLGVIGNGVVIDPHALISEIKTMAEQGIVIDESRLRIADNATLILSLHRELDALREDAASNSGTKIGTTRRGIGPAYEDKVGRRAIRVMDLANLETYQLKSIVCLPTTMLYGAVSISRKLSIKRFWMNYHRLPVRYCRFAKRSGGCSIRKIKKVPEYYLKAPRAHCLILIMVPILLLPRQIR